MMMLLLLLILCFHYFSLEIYAFQWHINDEIPSNRYFTFSEGYMFASNKGPFLLEQETSYIEIDTNVEI